MQQLTAAGVPVSAMIAPVIPAITDHEIERMLEAVARRPECGARGS
jgi:DNA repair photolyase